MARLQVSISMVDDAGAQRMHVALDDPTRLEYDRDPLYVFARLHTLTQTALRELHEQALAQNEKVYGPTSVEL